MKTITFETREQWMRARQGKITGTRLKDIVVKRGTAKKLGFYELIAERLAVDETEFEGYIPNETPMDRGTRLQSYAVERFRKVTGKQVDESLVLWTSDDNESIAYSPDGAVIGEPATVETKCLSSARHIEAYLTKAIPDEYEFQMLQSFIVNKEQQILYFCFYDPRIPAKDFFYLTIRREDVETKVSGYLAYQLRELAEVDEVVSKLLVF